MSAKVSEQEWVNRINNRPNVRFVRWDGGFTGARSKAIVRCEIDGYEWSVRITNLVHMTSGCPRCDKNSVRVDEQERINQINSKHDIQFVRWDGEFTGARSKAVCRCDVDGYEWSATVNCLVNQNQGCPQCAGKRRWTADERIEQINAKPNIKFIRWDGEFKGARSKAVCRCEIDGYEWSTSVTSLVNIGSGCPYCARYGKTEEQPTPNVTVEIPTDVKPAFDLLNW